MSRHLRCPEGHEWEPAGNDPFNCPVCARRPQALPTVAEQAADQAALPGAGLPPAAVPAELGAPGGEAAAAPAARAEEARAPCLPGFEILGVLGRGGMGVVYKARQLNLNRVVAVKMILTGGHAGPAELQRFRAEAEVLAQLRHPHVVQIYNVGDQGGRPFLVLEFVDGGNLAQKLDGRPLPPADAARLIELVARGAHAAHAAGIIHRDLKPANILLAGDGTPKITDFGLARKVDAGRGKTQTGAILGTPSYMAPEQAQARKDVGPAADVYALGAILYELLTGRPPFQTATTLDTVLAVIADEVVPPRALNAKVPRDLETICLKCLHKDPRRRYASARALAADLHRFQAGEPIRARRAPAWERGWRWLRRRPAVLASAALLLAGLLAAGFFYGDDASRLLANRGRVAIEGDEPGARVVLRRVGGLGPVAVLGPAGERQVTLDAGDYEAELAGDPEGLELSAEHLTVTRNGLEVIEVRKEVAEVLRLDGHRGAVVALALSPDGRLALSGSRVAGGDGSLRLWDVAARKEVRRLGPAVFDVQAVAFSPDGTRALSSGSDGVRLWDVETGREIRSFKGHKGEVRSVVFAPDGHRALTGGADKTLRLWDVDSGKELRVLEGHTEGVWGVRFSPDGRQAVSGGADGAVRLWDLDGGKEVEHFHGRHALGLLCVAFSPDGRLVASGGGDLVVRLWDTATGKVVRRLRGHTKLVTGVAFTPDGRQVVTASADRTVRVWDTASGRQRRTLSGHADGVLALAVAPDGRHVLSAGGVNFTDQWVLGHDFSLRWWALPRARLGPDAEGVRKPEVVVFRDHGEEVHGVAFSPDGTFVLSVSGAPGPSGTIRLWDPESGTEVRRFTPATGQYLSVAFAPDGRQALTSNSQGLVQLWDVATGTEKWRRIGQPAAAPDVAYSPDGKQALVSSLWGGAFLWNVAAGGLVRQFSLPTGAIQSVAFAPDGKRALTGGQDRTMRLWDLATGKELRRFTGHTNTISKVVFAPDGKQALSASHDGSVRLWDVATGAELLLLLGHQGKVHSVAFSPDGRRAVSVGQDKTLRLWDLDSGEETMGLEHASEVFAVAFAPDGTRVAAACKDHTVQVWEVPPPPGSAPAARGQVVIDTDTPSVPVVVKLQGRVVRAFNPQVGRAAALRVGVGYAVELAGAPAGLRVSPREFSLAAGQTQRLEVRRGPEYGGEVRRLEGALPGAGLIFAPGGDRLLCAENDGRLHRWDIPGGKELRVPNAPVGQVLALSSDGRRAVLAVREAVQVWDLEKGAEVCRLPAAQFPAAFLPGGRRVLTGSSDGNLRLWDADSGKELRRCDGHGSWVRSLAVAHDGKRALAGNSDGTMGLWDMDSGEEVRLFTGHHSTFVLAVALSPDGRLALSAGSDGTVRLWDVATGHELRRLLGHGGAFSGVAFTADGRRALGWGVGNPWCILWAVPDGRKLYVPGPVPENSLYSAATTATTGGAALGAWRGSDGTIHLWQVPDVPAGAPADDQGEIVVDLEGLSGSVSVRRKGELVTEIKGGGWGVGAPLAAGDYEVEWQGRPRGAELSPRQFTLARGGQQVIGVQRGSEFVGQVGYVSLAGGSGQPVANRPPAVLLPDGRQALTDRGDGVLVLCDLETGRVVRAYRGHAGSVLDLVLTPDGRRVVSAGADGTLRAWDMDAGRELTRCPDLGKSAARGLGLLPDGRQSLCGFDDHLVLVDWTTGKVVRRWAAPMGQALECLALAPDGLRALTGHRDGRVLLWDVAAGKQEYSFPPHAQAVQELAFSPDGRLALSTDSAGPARLWDVGARKELCRVPVAVPPAGAVAFTPDSQRFVISCGDNFVRVWDVAARAEVYRFANPVATSRFAAGGRRVVLNSVTGLTVWQLPGPDHDEGQLVVECDRSKYATVLVKRQGKTVMTLYLNGSASVCDLKEGDYELELGPGTAKTLRLSAEKVRVKVGRQQVVRVEQPPLQPPPIPPEPVKKP